MTYKKLVFQVTKEVVQLVLLAKYDYKYVSAISGLDLISTLILICLYLFSYSFSFLISYSRPSHVCCALSRAFSFARIDFRVLFRVRAVCHTLTRVLSRTRSDFRTLYRVF